jgi:hypothetical protein
MTESFWPDLPTEKVRLPHAILLEQANALAEQTHGLLVGQVRRSQDKQNFVSNLSIVAPSLNNYTYAVLSLNYPVGLYPLSLFFHARNQQFQIADEQTLLTGLKVVLSSDEIKRVMTGLLAQIQADEDVKAESSGQA